MSNQPTVARSKAPIAVSEAADIPRFIGEAGKRCKRLLTLIQNDNVKAGLRVGGDMLALHG
jgi:hypothetical protein